MFWFQLLVVAGVVFGAAAVAVGHGGSAVEAYPDRPEPHLPADRPLVPQDIDLIRFSVAFRGYRMDEVDTVLARLAAELAERDARIAELTGAAERPGADSEE